MVPLVLVYCTVLRTLKPCDWPLPSIPFHFFCACVCVHSSDSEPRRSRSLFESRRHPQNQHDVYTDVFATKSSKQASKQEGPLHDKSTSLASQMEMRFALLLFISSPFKLLISLLIYSFSFDVVTQEVARSNPPRFQNSLSVQEFYSTLAQLLHTKPFPVVRQGIATKKHAALATPSNKGIRRVFKALLCIMYI